MLRDQSLYSCESLALTDSRPPVDEVRGRYRLRYARTAMEVEACCRLRYEVFNVELGEGLAESAATGLDHDEFDAQCVHLMVVDETVQRVIGTYRLQTREMAEEGRGFYSAGEFDLSAVTGALFENTVELGRAAIAAEHRDKLVLFLLWRGLMAFLLWNRKRHLFGCSSLTSQDPETGLQASDWLARNGFRHEEFETPPKPGYECVVPGHEIFEGEFKPPKLFATYLRHGARLSSPPALDRVFGTIDFLTWLDSKQLDPRKAKLFSLGLPKR